MRACYDLLHLAIQNDVDALADGPCTAGTRSDRGDWRSGSRNLVRTNRCSNPALIQNLRQRILCDALICRVGVERDVGIPEVPVSPGVARHVPFGGDDGGGYRGAKSVQRESLV